MKLTFVKDFKHVSRDPEWKVPESAKSHEASERILALSQPKDFVKEYQMPGQSACTVSESAKQAKATQRVCELAKPRRTYEKDYEVEILCNPELNGK